MNKTLLSVGGLLLAVILIISGWFWLGARIERGVTEELARVLDAEVRVASVNLRLLAGQLQLVNGALTSRDPQAPWARASFAQASVTLKLADILAPVVPLTVAVDGAELELQPSARPAAPAPPPLTPARPVTSPDAPAFPRVRLQTISVKNLTLRRPADATFTAGGITAHLELAPNETSHLGTLTAATLTAGHFAITNLALQFTGDARQIQVDHFHAAIGSGLVTGSVTIPRHDPAAIHFNLNRVPVGVLLSAKWNVIISGLATGAGAYTGDVWHWQTGAATGALTLEQAALKAPPFLQPVKQLSPALATLGDISLDTARAGFRYTAGAFTLTDLNLAKTGVLALRGTVTVAKDHTLAGALQLGIPASVPLLFPKLKTDLFTTAADGWHWADFTLSGTPGDWHEDLTPRLRQAAASEGQQLLDQAKEGLDQIKEKAGRLLDKILGK
ncbi:MAG: hypothetical protein LBK60_03840 [Verrucomicrobiales bacterium]|jgi:hypothetical protein|nr:hypothetical protein [Verrucomicrobiales bacterium]